MGRLDVATSAGFLLCLTCLSGCGSLTQSDSSPGTRKTPVTETYHGVKVVDDYRWLEDGNNAEVRQWSESQNAAARALLDALPSRAAIADRVKELRDGEGESYFMLAWRNGKLFAMKRQPPKQQPLLVVMDSPDHAANARTVLDPNSLDPSGSTTIDFYEPSPDGNLIAVSLSKGGSEKGDVHVYDVSGKPTSDVVPRVQGGTAGGDVAWSFDAKGFFYTRYPHQGERPPEDLFFYQQVYFHRVGDRPEVDRYEVGKEFPKIAEVRLDSHPSRSYVIASVQHGDGGSIEHYLRGPDGKWQRVSRASDRVARLQFGPNHDLYVVTTRNAPRGQMLRMALAEPHLDRARTVIPEGEDALVSDFWEADANPVITNTRIVVPYQKGGPMVLKSFDLDGRPQPGPELLPISAVSAVVPMSDDVLFLNASYAAPPAWYRFSANAASTRRTALSTASPISFDDVEVVQGSALSKDGTRVPYVVLKPKGSTGKMLPMIVTGYGGYGVNRVPAFSPINRMLLDQGIALVDTVLRGGGEFGEQWHHQGRLTHKQNVFDDFAAVLKQLVERGETSADRLAIMGGSNGGLLMGATFTQHPELMKAVVARVGTYDMLRKELSSNGEFNTPEFGTVEDRDQFQALLAYSPYHHVRDGAAYPAILFMTGANDPRVDPMQSRKMTARLQASGTTRPVLLRTRGNTGHGPGTPLDIRIQQDVDIYSFLFHELGVKFRVQ